MKSTLADKLRGCQEIGVGVGVSQLSEPRLQKSFEQVVFLVALELDLDAGDGVVVGAVDQQAVLLLDDQAL